MGANRFYDFLLLHKYLGLSKMISLEHDPEMFKRAKFNVPYGFIELHPKKAAEFIDQDDAVPPSIYWLDYDGGIGGEILADIASFATKLKINDFCFVTVAGVPPGVSDNKNSSDRLAWLQDTLGEMAGDVTLEDAEKNNFHRAVHKSLIAAFRHAFAPRTEGTFIPLLQVVYTDTLKMVTVGGAFLAPGTAVDYRAKVNRVMPFLNTSDPVIYWIQSLHLTERERALFDRAVTSKSRRPAERAALTRLGFGRDDFDAYRDLVRYLPRYVETIV